MADIVSRFGIEVSAVVDEQSAKEAGKKLTTDVLNSLKDGYIKVPAAIETEFKKDKSTKELREAHKEFVNQWKKMSSVGFDSSSKDLDDFVKKYKTFVKLMNQSNRRDSKQNTALQHSGLDALLKDYTTTQKAIKKQLKAIRQDAKLSPSTGAVISNAEIEKDIKKHRNRTTGLDTFSRSLRKGASRAKAATPGAPIHLGPRQPSFGGNIYLINEKGVTDEATIERSPYATADAVNVAKDRTKMRKAERASLKTGRLTPEVEAETTKKQSAHEAAGARPYGTEYEIIKKILLNELAKIQGGLVHGRSDVETNDLINQTLMTLAHDEENGMNPLKSVNSIVNMLMNRYMSKGRIGATDGGVRGEGEHQEEANEALKQVLKILSDYIDARKDLIGNILDIKNQLPDKKIFNNLGSIYDRKLTDIQSSNTYAMLKNTLGSALTGSSDSKLANTVKSISDKSDKILTQNKVEAVSERVADDKELKGTRTLIDYTSKDTITGFNTDAKADELISKQEKTSKILGKDVLDAITAISSKNTATPIEATNTDESLLQLISDNVQALRDVLVGRQEPKPKKKTSKKQESTSSVMLGRFSSMFPVLAGALPTVYTPPEKGLLPKEGAQRDWGTLVPDKISSSELKMLTASSEAIEATTTKTVKSTFSKLGETLKNVFKKNKFPSVEQVLKMNERERAAESARRLSKYGSTRDGGFTDTGLKPRYKYIRSLWGRRSSKEDNPNLFSDINLTEGIGKINTDEILSELQTAIEKNMFSAQTGGGFWKNVIAPSIGYIGMPSLEKSRAEVEALNQILANIREKVLTVVNTISGKEATLNVMRENGEAKFDDNGKMISGTAEAKLLTEELEQQKSLLRSLLAEVSYIDDLSASCGNNAHEVLKYISFAMPELKKENNIIQNIHAGLDKSGKVLKFQKRTAEILDYSFKLMARSVGQMWKNWIAMLNPISLIKKAFSDFMSYDTKWQRTMNVIKYNIRSIIRPAIEWIAQKLVNIIGFFDIISMKIQEAFGNTPISLFDQKNADQFKKTYEEIASVSAGFDELHDISSSGGENDANNLLGDIYTPELSDAWVKFAEMVAKVFVKISEVIQWCIDNWKLLVGLWAGFKIAEGLLELLSWAKLLNLTLSGLNLITFGNLLAGLTGVLGTILLVKAAIDTIDWTIHWGGQTPEERTEAGDKNISTAEKGGALVGATAGWLIGKTLAAGASASTMIAAGVSGAIVGAAFVDGLVETVTAGYHEMYSLWKGVPEEAEHYAEKTGEGLGKMVGTAAGAKIGAIIGSAIAPGVGTAIGVAIGGIIGYVAGGEMGEALGRALAPLDTKFLDITRGIGDFQKLNISLRDVTNAEEMVTEKMQAYNDQLTKLNLLEQTSGESGKALYESVLAGTASYDAMTTAQQSVYDQYLKTAEAENILMEAKQQHLTYAAKYEEQLARESGDFTEYIALLQQGVEDGIISQEQMEDYFAQSYGKINADAKLLFIDQLPEYLRETVAEQGGQYETLGNKIATTWENIKSDTKQKWEDVKTNLHDTWENIKSTAHEKWDNIKTAIGDKVKSIYENAVEKFKNLKESAGETWDNIKTAAHEKWKNICDTITNWTKSIWESVTKVFDNIKTAAQNTWERVKNFFSGKGFKTNSQVDREGNATITMVETASYATGTNYIPSDGLAYLHQGEAVIPKKYNKPYEPQGVSAEEKTYLTQLMNTISRLDSTVKQGITVNGQFVQRGSDLVAVVNRTKSQTGADLLSNVSYAR